MEDLIALRTKLVELRAGFTKNTPAHDLVEGFIADLDLRALKLSVEGR